MSLSDLPQPIQDDILSLVEGEEKVYFPNRVYITEIVKCMRAAFFKRNLPKPPLDIDGAWNFYRGKLFDQRFGQAMYKGGGRSQDRLTYQVPREGKPPIIISGHLDFYDPTKDRIYELKTIANLHYITKSGAKPEHIEQALFYGYCFGTDKVSVLYVSMGEILECPLDHLFPGIDKIIEKFKTRANTLVKAIEAKTAPLGERANWEGGWRCKKEYCIYHNLCYPSELGKLKQVETMWKKQHPELYVE